MQIFDCHLDLAMNAMEWNRDLRQPIAEIRAREEGLKDKPDRGRNTVCFPEMRRGGVNLCVATLIARYAKPTHPLPGCRSPEQAWAQIQGQLAWYGIMQEQGEMRMIRNSREFAEAAAADSQSQAIGFVLSLECADALVTPAFVERMYAKGLRAIGPAHYGPGTYAHGTDDSGGLGQRGRELLKEMERVGMILDATHLCDDSFWEAMDHFSGPVWASHSNCRALVAHNRQFSDEQLKALIARGAVIGAALDAWMLAPGWIRGKTTPESSGVSLRHVADHIDHVCQIAGNAQHSGIGSDLDGAFGREQSPGDLDTIADLQKIARLLEKRGYSTADIAGIMRGNFVRFLENFFA